MTQAPIKEIYASLFSITSSAKRASVIAANVAILTETDPQYFNRTFYDDTDPARIVQYHCGQVGSGFKWIRFYLTASTGGGTGSTFTRTFTPNF